MLDKLEADILPKAGKWGVIGAKAAMIGAMTGALPIVLPVTAAVYLFYPVENQKTPRRGAGQ